MAPGCLLGHSRKEGEGTRMEDDACDPFLLEDISPSHSCFIQMDVFTSLVSGNPGDISFVRVYVLEDTVLPSRSRPSLSQQGENTK